MPGRSEEFFAGTTVPQALQKSWTGTLTFPDNPPGSQSPMGVIMNLAKIFIVAAISATAFSAQAAGVGVRAGTTGVGGDVGFNVAPTLDARVGYSYFRYKTTYNSDINYDAKFQLSNLNGLLDWSPFPGAFRFTGGLIANQNKVDLHSTGGTYRVNGVTYSSNDTSISGTVKSGRSIAPYLGIGYGNVARAGVNFYFDLGIMFMGSPKVSLSASCGGALNATDCATLRSNLENERARIESDLKKYRYFPVANIGITIGF